MFGWRELSVNWGWFPVGSAIALTLLTLLFLSQRFWYRSVWRVTAKWRIAWLRAAVRLVYVALLVLIIGSVADGFRMGYRHHLIPGAKITMFAGLWFTSALFAYIAVKVVRVIERLYVSFRSGGRCSFSQRGLWLRRRALGLPRPPRRNPHRQFAARSRRNDNRPA